MAPTKQMFCDACGDTTPHTIMSDESCAKCDACRCWNPCPEASSANC